MPSYLDILPEDALAHIYKMLYKSVVNDMKNGDKFKNIECFNKLLEISMNPYVDNLNYYSFVVNSRIDNILRIYKIGYKEDQYYNSLLYSSSLYYKSYYIKPLDIVINKIEIFNFFIYNLYKVDDKGLELFNDTYFTTSYYSGTMKGINKNGFVLEKDSSFRCLAEVIFYIINFYDYVKQILYMNIDMLDQLGDVLEQIGDVPDLSRASSAKIKERNNLIDILNYHLNHRLLDGILYDIINNCSKPLLK
jgi:hypothetical protein